MKEAICLIIVLAVVGVSSYILFSVLEFITETPKQLKRIADALERRNKNGKAD
jgi:predicted PurR-regulated permease PerM